MEKMLTAYIATALWSSNDESDKNGGEPLDKNYSRKDIHPETLVKMTEDVKKFLEENKADIGERSEDAGHDFWLTRNGHGAGFWDGDWEDEAGERLTQASKKFGEENLIVGDDEKIHQL
jgi:hypothetical protein